MLSLVINRRNKQNKTFLQNDGFSKKKKQSIFQRNFGLKLLIKTKIFFGVKKSSIDNSSCCCLPAILPSRLLSLTRSATGNVYALLIFSILNSNCM